MSLFTKSISVSSVWIVMHEYTQKLLRTRKIVSIQPPDISRVKICKQSTMLVIFDQHREQTTAALLTFLGHKVNHCRGTHRMGASFIHLASC